MSTITNRAGIELESPFPGLRPFEANESFLFFGRDSQTEELLRRLASRRFLAVVGSSGSGKSSLVRAGLLPALFRGYLVGAGSRWRIATIRPGDAPLASLAEGLAAALGLDESTAAGLLDTLSGSSLGLTTALRRAELAPGERFFILVDQFEELFRYTQGDERQEPSNEAFLFVEALLNLTGQLDVPVYVTITMRSDFLGDCAAFAGLSEALSTSQYLIPRLTRIDQEEAIRGPLRIVGVDATTRLVQQALNDSAEQVDQLPVLQHSLLRTFREWQNAGEDRKLDLEDYEKAGRMKGALDLHAEAVCAQLPDDAHRGVARRIFQCLTTIRAGRLIRRPEKLATIAAILEARENEEVMEQIRTVVRRFAEKRNSFLFFSGGELALSSVIDISHESLIRNWRRLNEWTIEEHEQSEWYEALARDAELHQRGEKGTWRDPALSRVVALSEKNHWNEPWALQYGSSSVPGDRRRAASFAQVMDFLEQSKKEQKAEERRKEEAHNRELEDAKAIAREQRRAKRLSWCVVGLILLLGAAGASFLYVTRMDRQETVTLQQAHANASQHVGELEEQIRLLLANRDEEGKTEAERARLEQEAANLRERLAMAEQSEEKAHAAVSQRQTNDSATRLIDQLQKELDVARKQLAEPSPQLRAMKSYFDVQVIARERNRRLEDTLTSLRAAGYSVPDAKVEIATVSQGLWIPSGDAAVWARFAADEIRNICRDNGWDVAVAQRKDFGPRRMLLQLQ
jgi:Novel STAND NTPase 1